MFIFQQFNMITISFVLYAVFTVANGNFQHYSSSGTRADDYINLNRLQYSRVLVEYDMKLKNFENHYWGRSEDVNAQKDMIVARIYRIEKHLNPYELLSDFRKNCVASYRDLIPMANHVRDTISHCVAEVKTNVQIMLNDAISTRNKLEDHYRHDFDYEIENCDTYSLTLTNYTGCIVGVVNATNTFVITNKKIFEEQLDIAECSANAGVKSYSDCSFNILDDTITKIAQAKLLIDRCFDGMDQINCPPCDIRDTCPEKMSWGSTTRYTPN